MAGRIRSIKPEILEDEIAAALSSDAWRLWVGMWLICDDYGRLRGEPRRLAASIFWGCPHKVDIHAALDELESTKRIIRYRVNGQYHIEVQNWSKHQRIDNASKTFKLPGPDEADNDGFAETRGEPPRDSAVRGSEMEGNGREKEKDPAPEKPGAGVEPVQEAFVLKAQPKPAAKAKASNGDFVAFLEAWQSAWVRTKHPTDGRPPIATDADRGQISQLLKRYPLQEALGYLERFMADADPFLIKTGHHPAHIAQRIDGYRSRDSTSRAVGRARPAEHNDVSEDATDKL